MSTSESMKVSISPRDSLNGSITAPGDKSISHRSLIISALADGISEIQGLSNGEDVLGTARIMEQLGAQVVNQGNGSWRVSGPANGLHASSASLDCGNSGTTIRLMMGVVAGIEGRHHLVGDASLSRRPMDRVARPLQMMGATIQGVGETMTPPVTVTGGTLQGIDYLMPMSSAQVKSAILLAGMSAGGPTTVTERTPTRPHTEEMLLEAGITLTMSNSQAGTTISIEPGRPSPRHWVVPADPSQAAFFVVAGLLGSSGEVTCRALYPGETRTGFLGVLERMGASLERRVDSNGLLDVTTMVSSLAATTVDASEIPSLDEVPILAVAAAAAEGISVFRDVGELRIKESDRLLETIGLVEALGAEARAEGDNLIIEGLGSSRRFTSFTIDAHGDHRMAMAGAIAATVGAGGVVDGFESVATSYPAFLEHLDNLT